MVDMLIDGPIKPVPADLDRRWLCDDYFDLFVWYGSNAKIYGFQLCYDKPGRERALTWTADNGFVHGAVDSGESRPTANRTPTLTGEPTFAASEVEREFIARSATIPGESRAFVLERIGEYGSAARRSRA